MKWMRYIKCTLGNGLKKQTIAKVCGLFIHSLNIFLVRLFKIMRRRIDEIMKLITGLLLILDIGYIAGQAGMSDFDEISILQLLVRTGIGIAVLAFGTWLINYLGKEDEYICHR